MYDRLTDTAGNPYLIVDTDTGVQHDDDRYDSDQHDRSDVPCRNITVHDPADKDWKEHGECGRRQH